MAGDSDLLAAERQLHQSYRWTMDLPLRFEAQHWMRDFYAAWRPDGWIKGNLNYLEYERPLYLLKHRIIDAWLCGAPDCPSDPELTWLQLFEMPMRLVARHDHPLLRRPAPLSLADVAAYPLQPLPERAFPVFHARLRALGLAPRSAGGQPRVAVSPAEADAYQARMLGIASALTLPLYGPEYRLLPVEIPIQFGDGLVIRSEFVAHRRCHALIETLLAHIRAATAGCPEVRLLEPRAVCGASPALQPC